jgi:hypothetical protein
MKDSRMEKRLSILGERRPFFDRLQKYRPELSKDPFRKAREAFLAIALPTYSTGRLGGDTHIINHIYRLQIDDSRLSVRTSREMSDVDRLVELVQGQFK